MIILQILFTLTVRFLFAVIFILSLIPIGILVFLVPQKYRYNRLYFAASALVYNAIVKAMCTPVRIRGREHIPQEPAIIVVNHSSSLDIPLIGSLCGMHPHIWLAMTWLTKFIEFRYFLPRVAVLVDMSSPQKGMRALIQTMHLIKEHNAHVIIFPEGRRYTDSKIHDFYGGFAILAKKTGLPVLPVYIHNLNKLYPPEKFLMQRCTVDVTIGTLMRIGDGESDKEFKDRVHAWFMQHVQQGV